MHKLFPSLNSRTRQILIDYMDSLKKKKKQNKILHKRKGLQFTLLLS